MSDAPEAEAENVEDAPTVNSMAAFSDKMQDLEEALSLLYIRNNASGRRKFKEKWPEVATYIFGEQLIQYDTEGTQDREHRSQLEQEAGDRRIQMKHTISEIVEKSVDKGSLLFDYVGEVIDKYGPDVSPFLYAEDVIERVRPGLLAARKARMDEDEKEQKREQDKEDSDIAAKGHAAAEANAADRAERELGKEEVVDAGDTSPVEQESPEPQEDRKLSAEEKSILSNVPEEMASVEPVIEETIQEAPSVAPPSLPEDTYDDVMPIETSAPLPSDADAAKEELQEEVLAEVASESEAQEATEVGVEEKQETTSEPSPVTKDSMDDVKPIETPASADLKEKEEAEVKAPVSDQEIAPESSETSKDEAEGAVVEKVEDAVSEEIVQKEPDPEDDTPTKMVEKGVYMAMFNAVALKQAA